MFEPAKRRPRIYSSLYEVAQRLASLEMPMEILTTAVQRGHLDRRLATRNDFPGRGEYDAASRALRTICEEGVRSEGGWHRSTYLGIPVAYNYWETVAVSVTSGDENVGQAEAEDDPRVRPVKGPNTSRATKPRLQLTPGDPTAGDDGVSFWYLLTYADDERVWAELSNPDVPELEGSVDRWRERIILGEVDLTDGGSRTGRPDLLGDPYGAEIEINPVRKTS